MNRPDGDPARPSTVAPGEYRFGSSGAQGYSVVWWDPHVLALGTSSPFGLRRDDLIAKDGEPSGVEARLSAYHKWRNERDATVAAAKAPSMSIRIASDLASRPPALDAEPADIQIVDVSRLDGRPFGPRFGTLVHATLATIPITADEDVVRAVAGTQARILLAAEEEAYAAVEVVIAALRHPLFDRVRAADLAGTCFRELPILWRAPDGALVEGTLDLAFEDETGTTVVDFKTGRELDADVERYKRQLTIYCRALESLRGGTVRGVLMRV